MTPEEYNCLSDKIIKCCIEVHRNLGPGLLESVYETCLSKELELSNINHRRQVYLPVVYKNEQLDANFRPDFLVEDAIILELKAIEFVLPVHEVQLVTYLKLADKRLGLLINFYEDWLIKGIKRKVNNF
ncbi:MAG: GxxExxY protein [Bacteroidota bacterium]